MGVSYNRAILVGRLTKDPESSYSSTGTHISKFTLAVDRPSYLSGPLENNTDFLRVVTFGKTADFVANYMAKGRLVLVEGRIQISKWQDSEGVNRYSTDIIADKVNFMETKKTSGDGHYGGEELHLGDEVHSQKKEITTKDNSNVFSSPTISDDDECPF